MMLREGMEGFKESIPIVANVSRKISRPEMIAHSVEVDEMRSSVVVDEKVSGVEIPVAALRTRKLMKESEGFLRSRRVNGISFVD